MTSPQLPQGDEQAAVGELAAVELVAPGRQRDGPLEGAIRDFDSVDRGAARARGELAVADDDQRAVVEHHLDALGLDARQRHRDLKLVRGFEQVDRRLPGRPGSTDPGLIRPEDEELPLQAVRPVEKLASLGPHPGPGIARHVSPRCPDQQRLPIEPVPNLAIRSPAGVPQAATPVEPHAMRWSRQSGFPRPPRMVVRPAGLALLVALPTGAAHAQTDEIQVYNGEIVEPAKFGLTLHNNYIAIGRKQADFPGGVRPDGSLNGVTEFAYGVNEWFELGAYMPF